MTAVSQSKQFTIAEKSITDQYIPDLFTLNKLNIVKQHLDVCCDRITEFASRHYSADDKCIIAGCRVLLIWPPIDLYFISLFIILGYFIVFILSHLSGHNCR